VLRFKVTVILAPAESVTVMVALPAARLSMVKSFPLTLALATFVSLLAAV
jgi:hypothetical protein